MFPKSALPQNGLDIVKAEKTVPRLAHSGRALGDASHNGRILERKGFGSCDKFEREGVLDCKVSKLAKKISICLGFQILRYPEAREECGARRIKPRSDQPFGNRLMFEIHRRVMEAGGDRHSKLGNAIALPLLTRGMINFENIYPLRDFRMPMGGQRVQAGTKDYILINTPRNCQAKLILGIAVAKREQERRVSIRCPGIFLHPGEQCLVTVVSGQSARENVRKYFWFGIRSDCSALQTATLRAVWLGGRSSILFNSLNRMMNSSFCADSEIRRIGCQDFFFRLLLVATKISSGKGGVLSICFANPPSNLLRLLRTPAEFRQRNNGDTRL